MGRIHDRGLYAWLACLLPMLAPIAARAAEPAPAGGAASEVTLVSSANPAPFGQLVFFTASVTSATPPIPTGSVTIFDGDSPLLTADVDENGQLLTATNLPTGTHALTASYAGDGVHAPAVSDVLIQVIEPPASAAAVVSSANPSVTGQAVTFTASVWSTGFGNPTPTGSVTFLDGATPLGTATLDAAQATLTTDALDVGTHAITVEYSGDANNTGSTSPVLSQIVNAASVDVVVTLGTDPPPACGTLTEIDVVAGTPVNYCFTVTNHTAQALSRHTLTSDVFDLYSLQPGDAFFDVLFELDVAPGASAQYNKVVTAGSTSDLSFTWTAFAAAPSYRIDDQAPADFIDISASGAKLGVPAYLPLPFEFTLYGRTFVGADVDGLCVYNNGAAQFVPHPDICGGTFPLFGGDDAFPPPPDANDSLLPYWDALGSAGNVYYAVVGDAPNRRFVVEWKRKNHSFEEIVGLGCEAAPEECGITFEMILDEASGDVTFSYADVEFDTEGGDQLLIDHGASAGIALIDTWRELRQEYSVEQPILADGRTIRWTRTQRPYVVHAQAHVGVGRPEIVVAPGAITATAREGDVLIRSLTIGNEGDLALEWTLDRVPAGAHVPSAPRHVPPIGDPSRTSIGLPPAESGAAEAWRPSNAPVRSPSGVFDVPAYGVRAEPLQYTELVGLDAVNPGAFVRVGVTHETLAGDFVGNDFTREYVITQCEETADECFDTIDTASGALTEIAIIALPEGPSGIEQGWTGMAWDATTRTLYASASTCGRTSENRSYLYAIDYASGVPTGLAEIVTGSDVCIMDIAVAPNGQMYGLDLYNDALIAIDKNTGAAQAIGSIGFDANYRQSMDFDDSTGVLYLAGYTDSSPALVAMYTVDLTTGAATNLGRFDYDYSFMNLAALAIAAPGGVCAQPGEVPWLFFDLGGGTTEPGTESSARVVLDATGLSPGRYSANICVSSNDPARRLLGVPVELDIADDDALFASGFEAMP